MKNTTNHSTEPALQIILTLQQFEFFFINPNIFSYFCFNRVEKWNILLGFVSYQNWSVRARRGRRCSSWVSLPPHPLPPSLPPLSPPDVAVVATISFVTHRRAEKKKETQWRKTQPRVAHPAALHTPPHTRTHWHTHTHWHTRSHTQARALGEDTPGGKSALQVPWSFAGPWAAAEAHAIYWRIYRRARPRPNDRLAFEWVYVCWWWRGV